MCRPGLRTELEEEYALIDTLDNFGPQRTSGVSAPHPPELRGDRSLSPIDSAFGACVRAFIIYIVAEFARHSFKVPNVWNYNLCYFVYVAGC